jgi:hypothetical protein
VAQEDFEQYIRSMAKRPYRKLVEERFRSTGAPELVDSLQAAEARFPQRLQPFLPHYLQAASDKFLGSRLFWEVSSCREAFANILELATETMPDDAVRQAFRKPFADNGVIAQNVFEVSTASFAVAAAESRQQRRFMGIKKHAWG